MNFTLKFFIDLSPLWQPVAILVSVFFSCAKLVLLFTFTALPDNLRHISENSGTFRHYGANLCEVISNRSLIGDWRFLYEKYSKLSNLFAIFCRFVYDNLKWYLVHILCLQNCCADKFAQENVLVVFSNVSFVGYFSVQVQNNLTASFFETGAITVPTKLENLTILGQGGPASAQ